MIFSQTSCHKISASLVFLAATREARLVHSSQCNFSPTIPLSNKKTVMSNDGGTRVALQATYTPPTKEFINKEEDSELEKFCSVYDTEREDATEITKSDLKYHIKELVQEIEDGRDDRNNIHSIEIHLPKESAITGPIERTISESTTSPSDDSNPRWKSMVKKLISLYLHFLGKYALVTKCITSGTIGTLGDLLAQCFEHSFLRNNHIKTVRKTAFALDRIRLFGILFEATFVSGPLMHFAYDCMEYLVPIHDDDNDDVEDKASTCIPAKSNNNNSRKKWLAAGFHVSADLFILGPIFVFTMMLFTSLIEGKLGTFGMELKLDFIPAVYAASIASFAFLPAQLLAFKHLPIKFRLLYMNFQDVVWNAVVSVMAHKSRN